MFLCPSPNLLSQTSVIDGPVKQENILAASTLCSTHGAPVVLEVTAEMSPDLSLHAWRAGLLHSLLEREYVKLVLFSNCHMRPLLLQISECSPTAAVKKWALEDTQPFLDKLCGWMNLRKKRKRSRWVGAWNENRNERLLQAAFVERLLAHTPASLGFVFYQLELKKPES